MTHARQHSPLILIREIGLLPCRCVREVVAIILPMEHDGWHPNRRGPFERLLEGLVFRSAARFAPALQVRMYADRSPIRIVPGSCAALEFLIREVPAR